MAGEILKQLGVTPGAPVTQDILEKAKKAWMQIYLFFMLLTAPANPIKRERLEDMRIKLAEANELIAQLEIQHAVSNGRR